jgi:hypothetical protein
VLVNNAGVMGLPLTHTADGFERIWGQTTSATSR